MNLLIIEVEVTTILVTTNWEIKRPISPPAQAKETETLSGLGGGQVSRANLTSCSVLSTAVSCRVKGRFQATDNVAFAGNAGRAKKRISDEKNTVVGVDNTPVVGEKVEDNVGLKSHVQAPHLMLYGRRYSERASI